VVPKLTSTAVGTYLRDCWYVAGWAADLGTEPQQRVFLEEPIALFRDESGKANAVSGRCPHRFAPLGQGKVMEGALMCPYHGLRFDGTGACVHNPHPGGQLPENRLRVYPLAERHALLWIWMGDASSADPALIPDFSWLSNSRWEAVRGATLAEGHYELYSDNILDLSHANFVHPALVSAAFTEGDRKFWQDGETVHAEYIRLDDYLSEGIGGMLGRIGQKQDFYGWVVWHAPAVLYFDFRAGAPGTPREDCTLLPSIHAFTPETPDTTHYFWATARDFALGDAEFTAGMHAALEFAFEQEDMPLIRDSHRLMRGADFWDLQPLVLGGDGGGVRARRMLQRLITREKLPQAAE
jgi:vanillate O-demethylase monooxygenase subunit